MFFLANLIKNVDIFKKNINTVLEYCSDYKETVSSCSEISKNSLMN